VIEANHKLVYENVQILSEEIKTKLRILNKINELSKETPFDWNLTAFQNLVDRSTEFQSFPVYTKQAQPYLPVIRSNQKTLVLDLDETLVHKSGNLVLIRPGAEQFLKEVSQEYEVVIFTAAMQSYADFAMRKLDPDNLVKLRLYRQNVSFDQQGPFKDLEMIGRELKNVVIVDNLETNFRYQRENGICIKTWTGDLNDQELYKLASIVKEFFQNKEST
jgi:Dullard-like phosphatase family protein